MKIRTTIFSRPYIFLINVSKNMSLLNYNTVFVNIIHNSDIFKVSNVMSIFVFLQTQTSNL
jgi:hypothetical protein